MIARKPYTLGLDWGYADIYIRYPWVLHFYYYFHKVKSKGANIAARKNMPHFYHIHMYWAKIKGPQRPLDGCQNILKWNIRLSHFKQVSQTTLLLAAIYFWRFQAVDCFYLLFTWLMLHSVITQSRWSSKRFVFNVQESDKWMLLVSKIATGIETINVPFSVAF